MKPYTIQPYNAKLYVCKDCNAKQATKMMRKITGAKHKIHGCLGQVVSCGPTVFVYVRDSKDINSVAHESLHVAFDILSWCEVAVDDSRQEALAYLVGHVAELIVR